jgi:hypothetical protein
MLTMKVTRYFTNGEVEVCSSLTFDVLNNDVDNATKAVCNTLDYDFDLPDLDGDFPWREMTDDEAKDYQKRQEPEDVETRRERIYADEDDE